MTTLPYKVIKQNADTLTPITIFSRLTGQKKFLLESSFEHEQKGKFSFIGVNPYQEIIGHGDHTTLTDHDKGTQIEYAEEPLQYVQNHLPKIELDLPFPFYGGAIGYIGYDAIRQVEDIGKPLTDDQEMPDVHLMLYQDVIVYEHTSETVYLVAINLEQQSEAMLDARLDKLQQALTSTAEIPTSDNMNPVTFLPETTKDAFMEKVETAKERIKQGDIFQVVLSQRMQADFDGNPLSFYRKLRKANASPYMFYIDFADYLVLGASPESLIQTSGRHVIANPIAGTRGRGQTDQEETMLEADLLSDEKELAEHQMLVDLSRNDLGRVCEIGSITTPIYMTIEKYQHVMHIVSEVHGQLKQGISSIDALRSSLPAGTVSGAPKIRAMQIINELEETKRGPYAGGIGYISFNHDLNIALAIRSLIIKDQKAYLQAGAGIVYDSIPEKEFEETLRKARSLMEVTQYDLTH
ncbi:anthranilate synthase component I [Lentibacillus sp. N15]|uniref:anthranilate synthase component I n=1 Tax=Lentibacillus songyuanensis TaxID=3136161 RepID=UPI0031BA2C11